ncbi:J domain-containing protein [Peptoniphilus equinus]|uniref:J domain-containing protein n=1 Tax=Peptoniphilus equinus TaxID=3016343 RepID=A0ABY7QSK4_9FIRM|nr:J domain-containing protein [Peptoniphilus equinus]WBW49306.1 J domain-containing protein [Peptoniphilus equinus]
MIFFLATFMFILLSPFIFIGLLTVTLTFEFLGWAIIKADYLLAGYIGMFLGLVLSYVANAQHDILQLVLLSGVVTCLFYAKIIIPFARRHYTLACVSNLIVTIFGTMFVGKVFISEFPHDTFLNYPVFRFFDELKFLNVGITFLLLFYIMYFVFNYRMVTIYDYPIPDLALLGKDMIESKLLRKKLTHHDEKFDYTNQSYSDYNDTHTNQSDSGFYDEGKTTSQTHSDFSSPTYSNEYIKACYTLGCEPEDEFEMIRKRYKYLLKNLHPDKNNDQASTEYVQKLNNAMDYIQKHYPNT